MEEPLSSIQELRTISKAMWFSFFDDCWAPAVVAEMRSGNEQGSYTAFTDQNTWWPGSVQSTINACCLLRKEEVVV